MEKHAEITKITRQTKSAGQKITQNHATVQTALSPKKHAPRYPLGGSGVILGEGSVKPPPRISVWRADIPTAPWNAGAES